MSLLILPHSGSQCYPSEPSWSITSAGDAGQLGQGCDMYRTPPPSEINHWMWNVEMSHQMGSSGKCWFLILRQVVGAFSCQLAMTYGKSFQCGSPLEPAWWEIFSFIQWLSGEGCFQPRARFWKGGCIWLCPKFVLDFVQACMENLLDGFYEI